MAEGTQDLVSEAVHGVLGFADPVVVALVRRAAPSPAEARDVGREAIVVAVKGALAKVLDPEGAGACGEAVATCLLTGTVERWEEASDEDDEEEDGAAADSHHAVPWQQRPSPGAAAPAQDSGALARELEAFVEYVACRDDELWARNRIEALVGETLASKFPGAQVTRYGSSAFTGLGLFSSDLDLCLRPCIPLQECVPVLADCAWVMDLAHVHARVPICTFEHRQSGVPVDLSSPRTITSDMQDVGAAAEPFAATIVFLKVLLKTHGLDEVFSGGLGSFRLYLMVTHLLARSHSAAAGASLADQVLQVLDFYGRRFDWGQTLFVAGVSADFEPVKTTECQSLFRATHETLSAPGASLSRVLDVRRLEKRRQASLRRCRVWREADSSGGPQGKAKGKRPASAVAADSKAAAEDADTAFGSTSDQTAVKRPRLDQLLEGRGSHGSWLTGSDVTTADDDGGLGALFKSRPGSGGVEQNDAATTFGGAVFM